jgi:dihydropyrimidinase
LDEIGSAFSKGLRVRGETCTHYLTLDESNLAKPNFEGAKYVCSPALRKSEHFTKLWSGLKKGWLNAISSDHCGFDWATQKHIGKDDFRNIPNGAPGLEHRLAVLWSEGVAKGKITRQELVDYYATTPAKNNGIDYCKGAIAVGYDADIVLYDPSGESIIANKNSLQGVDYTPYEGMTQFGHVEKVWLRGELIVDGGKYVGNSGQGKLVKGKPYGLMYR